MTAKQFVEIAKKIATQRRTLYVSGGWGQVATPANKTRAINQYPYNKNNAAKIRNAASDTFFFDCVCLIKSILWGFNFNKAHTTGGAVYASNGVPDVGEGTMINLCKNVSQDFKTILPGCAVWMPGHIGIYIGDGLAVECTPAWNDSVQITAVGNIGAKSGFHTRTWVKHGQLPWVDYMNVEAPAPAPDPLSAYSDETLAHMVIARQFGDGVVCRAALGSRFEAVQKIVDNMLRVAPKVPDPVPGSIQKVHVVGKGENLTIIAKKYNTSVDRIANDNKIINRNLIHVGQRLIING